MSKRPSVIVLAPRFSALARFGAESLEADLRIGTGSGHPASLPNLESLINSPLTEPRLGQGLAGAPPLAGYYLESFLEQHGYAARALFDWPDDDLAGVLADDPLAILISTTLITDPRVLARFLGTVRRAAGGVHLIVGGPLIFKQSKLLERDPDDARQQALAGSGGEEPPELLFTAGADQRLDDAIYVAAPFGEHTLLQVLARLDDGAGGEVAIDDVPNLVRRDSHGNWRLTGRQPEPVDIDRDYPRWDLIDELPTVVPVRASIGCPHRCRYCDFYRIHPQTKLRSVESITAEIAAARARGGVFINFVDDNVFTTAERAVELSRGLIDREIDVVWGGMFRADRVDEGNVELLRESGCRFGVCGVESAAPDQLERMGRDCEIGDLEAGVELATAAGIDIALTFIVGFPGETAATLDATAAFVNRLTTTNPGSVSFELYPFYLTPDSAADGRGFRKKHQLRGRRDRWSHATMSVDDVLSTWIPRVFRAVERAPYNYVTSDNPRWWDTDKRSRAWAARRELTLAFLDGADDALVQERFAGLYRLIADPERADAIPGWDELLAGREHQPRRIAP